VSKQGAYALILGIFCTLVFLIALMGTISYDTHVNHLKMQACLSSPQHEWVENDDHDFECRYVND